MLRTILAFLFVAIFLITTLPFYGITWIIAKWNKPFADNINLRYVQWAFRVVMWISGVRVRHIGLENIPADTPVLFVSNHRGMFDIIAAYACMPHLTGFIAKDNIAHIPILSFVMRRIYCLFLDRKDLRKGYQTILRSIDYVKNGISIFIFPEGTRSKQKDPLILGEFHDGSFKPAQRVGCPIIPVATVGAEAFFEQHPPFLSGGQMTLAFGEPVYYKDLSDEEKKHIGKTFQSRISAMLETILSNPME